MYIRRSFSRVYLWYHCFIAVLDLPQLFIIWLELDANLRLEQSRRTDKLVLTERTW